MGLPHRLADALVSDARVLPLEALDHTAEGSNQPAYKSIVVRLEPSDGGRTGVVSTLANTYSRGDEKKRHVEPDQLS